MKVLAGSTLIALMIGGLAAQERAGSSPAPSRTVWDGVYTSQQADRGHAAYDLHCASCHRDDLSGYDGILRGSRFMEKYREASLDLLFGKTKSTMPRNSPGSLSDQMYADILTYVLQSNEMPAGASELQPEDIAAVRLISKDGPSPVPNFSLVRIVGCVAQRGDEWLLTSSTEAERTALPQPAAGELANVESVAGTRSYSLMASYAYSPAKHLGRIAEVRGFLIRRPSEDRINVTSLETVGPACGQ